MRVNGVPGGHFTKLLSLFAGWTTFLDFVRSVTMERNSGDARRRDREKIMVQEGMEVWRQKQQEQRAQKIQEQREVRRLLRDRIDIFCVRHTGQTWDPATLASLLHI